MLYHYTSLNGFIGVLQNSSIWATHTSYQNDSSEFFHGLDHAKHFAGSIFMEDDYLSAFGWEVRHAMEQVRPDNLFIASFSEKPDLLSQWRGYCPPGAGLCLGFDIDALRKFCLDRGYRLEKCIYQHTDQENSISSLVDECLKLFPKPSITRQEYNQLPSKQQVDAEIDYRILTSEGAAKTEAKVALEWLQKQIIEVAPLFKNHGFHEEAEWRIVAHNPKVPRNFRAAKSYIAPYIELPVLGETKSDVLKEVIVGPSPNQQRCASSVQEFLKDGGFFDVEVRLSKIPFNSW